MIIAGITTALYGVLLYGGQRQSRKQATVKKALAGKLLFFKWHK